MRFLATLVAVFFAAWGHGASDLSAWRVRRTFAIPPASPKQPKMPGLDCVYVEFPTSGFLQPDGRDLRVVMDGKPAPFKIVDIGFGGYVKLVAGITGSSGRMEVYYGNPSARPLRSDWEPRRGVWLETRPYNGPRVKNLVQLRRAIAQTAERYGAGPTGQIFHGFNPYGPQDNYLSIYRGWLYLPREQTVTFAVVADEIGCLVVEGREAAAKWQWGPMPRNRRFAGQPMKLSAGLHPIVMYHIEASGRQAAGAAWWMPGMPRGKKYLHFKIIPPKAFAPIRYGKPLDYRVRGQPVSPDFAFENAGDVLLGDSLLVRFVFRDRSCPPERALRCQPTWDFGDGTTSTSREPNHVYLRPGDYTVTLALNSASGTWRVSQKIRVGPGYERAARRQWDRLEQYLPILQEYQFEKMKTEDLMVAARVFEKLENKKGIVTVGSILYERGKELDEKDFVWVCLLLGRNLRDYKPEEEAEGQPKEEKTEEQLHQEARARAQKAIAIFSAAEERTKDLKAKARLANEKGDVYYYFLGDLERAEQEYTKTLTKYAKAASDQVRLAQIRIGDLYKTKGDYEAALRAYQRAADMAIHNYPEEVELARRGSFPRTIEDYIRRRLFKEAHQTLNQWDWEFPTDKLVGYSSYLRARLALAEGNKPEAIKQASELLRVNKASEYADDLLLFLADLHVGSGDLDKALAALGRLLKDYPESDLQDEAHILRVRICLQQANYEAAAAEALEVADSNPDGDHAPEALLLAATALRRAKNRGKALSTLERLAEKYPTTPQGKKAQELLKEFRRR